MKPITLSIIISVAIIGGAFFITKNNGGDAVAVNKDNISMVDGKQIIEISAKGGYSPQRSVGKAGIPTILRVDTDGTFDCSSSIRIPSMDISKNLPNSGITDIELGNPKVGVLDGTCGMGMYPFEIDFKS